MGLWGATLLVIDGVIRLQLRWHVEYSTTAASTIWPIESQKE